MRIRPQRPWLLVGITALAGCASVPPPAPAPVPRTDVRYHAVDNKGTRRYTLNPSQTAVLPAVGPANKPPVYPTALVARHLPPVDVRAKLIVDREGKVTDVRFADADRAGPVRRAFEQAVRAATLEWTFVPMRIKQWKSMPGGGAKVVKNEPMPFSQDYVFRFALVDGKPVVTGATP